MPDLVYPRISTISNTTDENITTCFLGGFVVVFISARLNKPPVNHHNINNQPNKEKAMFDEVIRIHLEIRIQSKHFSSTRIFLSDFHESPNYMSHTKTYKELSCPLSLKKGSYFLSHWKKSLNMLHIKVVKIVI